jgi:hypothetical protein
MQLVQKLKVTRGQHLPIYRCRAASQVSLFVEFLISWISLPTKTTKIGTSRIKVISQYIIGVCIDFDVMHQLTVKSPASSILCKTAVNKQLLI